MDRIIVTRSEARAIGAKRYFTGNACRHGHVAERLVSNGACLACCAAKDQVRGKIRYARDPAAWREKTKRWEVANRERLLAMKREWKKKNPESVRASARKAYAKDPAKAAAKYHNRRARKIANGGVFTSADIAEIRAMQRDRCAICTQKLKSKGTVDHIEPLARGGTNDRRNLQLLCSACNARKCARDPVDHMRSVGFLL